MRGGPYQSCILKVGPDWLKKKMEVGGKQVRNKAKIRVKRLSPVHTHTNCLIA